MIHDAVSVTERNARDRHRQAIGAKSGELRGIFDGGHALKELAA